MKRYINFLALMVFLPMSYASDDDDDASSATLVEQEVIYACVKYDKKEGSLKKDSPLRYTEPFEDCKKNEVRVSWNTIGPEGPEGPAGADGIDGAPGAKGAPGVPGQDGVNGANGFNGLDGQDGAEGAPGAKGDKGDLGIPGQDGANGSDGAKGAPGVPGAKGAPGVPGQDGVNGANGSDGLNGQDGADGIDGVGFDGLDGSSCSVAQVGSSAVITCEDGTSAALASAGTVVVYPEGTLGEAPPLSYPTGALVVVDATGVILGEALGASNGRYQILIEVPGFPAPGGFDYVFISDVSATNTVQLFGLGEFYFLEENCQGYPFIANHNPKWNSRTGEYFAFNPFADGPGFTSGENLLFKSWVRSTNIVNNSLNEFPCLNEEIIAKAWLGIPFNPAPEILNAAYPVSLQQLP